MREAIDWADTVWIEWANELAVNASKYINIWDKDVYCRLHSYEALANYPAQIDWRVFKKLIFVAPHIQDIIFDQWPTIKRVVDTEIIYNGVDPVKPIGKPGYNIAVVGGISHKKAPELALQVLKFLPFGYNLYFAGAFQEKRYELYLKHIVKEMEIENRVHFLGHVENMDEFWKDKNFLLNTSIHEGHNVSILEAMARDIKPMIHNFKGATELYPSEFLFDFLPVAKLKILEKPYGSSQNVLKLKGWTKKNQIEKIKRVLDV